MPVFNDVRMTPNSVDGILTAAGDQDLEIVLVDNGSRADVSLALAMALEPVPRVRLERLRRNCCAASPARRSSASSHFCCTLMARSRAPAPPSRAHSRSQRLPQRVPEGRRTDGLPASDSALSPRPPSVPWAEKMSKLSKRPALPQLQATDPERFHPATSQEPHSGGVLFVGQARSGGVPWQIVADALAAGVPLEVWRPNWTDLIDRAHLRGEYLDYAHLPVRYRQASRVLNDHWTDMVADLQMLCSAAGDLMYPDDAELVQVAARVGREHSFAARAKTMLGEAARLSSSRGTSTSRPDASEGTSPAPRPPRRSCRPAGWFRRRTPAGRSDRRRWR